MKLKHRIPVQAYFRSEEVTPAYQAEVDGSTAKTQAAYERAQRKLAAAERRLASAEAVSRRRIVDAKRARASAREMLVAVELVELRREELQRIEALMKGVPSSTEHRGRGAFRPVPQPGPQI
jgi:hypothetical protein